MISEDDVWKCLEQIPDPEIPVLNIVELGVIRKVQITNNHVTIMLTPTYSGCPA
ncbi:MAG: metal-sulfur cluster assembly factor, partial [Bacteroidia bacterium]